MQKAIVCRGPSGPSMIETAAMAAIFVVSYSLGLGLVVSLILSTVACWYVSSRRDPRGPGRWTE
jgi:hypothetical protein